MEETVVSGRRGRYFAILYNHEAGLWEDSRLPSDMLEAFAGEVERDKSMDKPQHTPLSDERLETIRTSIAYRNQVNEALVKAGILEDTQAAKFLAAANELLAEVEWLRAEVEREREARTQEYDCAGADMESMARRIRELKAENATIRAVLRAVIDDAEAFGWDSAAITEAHTLRQQWGRAAEGQA